MQPQPIYISTSNNCQLARADGAVGRAHASRVAGSSSQERKIYIGIFKVSGENETYGRVERRR